MEWKCQIGKMVFWRGNINSVFPMACSIRLFSLSGHKTFPRWLSPMSFSSFNEIISASRITPDPRKCGYNSNYNLHLHQWASASRPRSLGDELQWGASCSHPSGRKAAFRPLNRLNKRLKEDIVMFPPRRKYGGSDRPFTGKLCEQNRCCGEREQWSGDLKSREAGFIGFTALFSWPRQRCSEKPERWKPPFGRCCRNVT